ncbi:MAG: hypothetical protein HOP13_10920 [Alphaproteobacteria bacterium]|nr:hypothetical protein [Alphaproteobacteria bacterium]
MKQLLVAVAASAACVLFVPLLPAAADDFGCSSSPSKAECDNVSLPKGGIVRAVAESHSDERGNSTSVKIQVRDLSTGQLFETNGDCGCATAEAKLRLTHGGTFEIVAIQGNNKAVATSTTIYIAPTP